MSDDPSLEALRRAHTPEAVRRRLGRPRRAHGLRPFVLGAIDGVVTTFAVVAGVAGASLDDAIVIVLGVANLGADGFSMAASAFLSSRAERQRRLKAQREEEEHVRLVPDGEAEELRQVFAAKGLDEPTVERVVAALTSDRRLWVDSMLAEELGFAPADEAPLRMALVTFLAFVAVGAVPLAAYVVDAAGIVEVDAPLAWSTALAACAFFVVGALKARFVDQSWWRSGGEALLLGGAAAACAYLLGVALAGVA